MNNKYIEEKIREKIGGSKAQAERILDLVIYEIIKAIDNGKDVRIARLGIFKSRKVPERTARNPKTGESVKVPAMKKIKFSPAKSFKEKINTF